MSFSKKKHSDYEAPSALSFPISRVFELDFNEEMTDHHDNDDDDDEEEALGFEDEPSSLTTTTATTRRRRRRRTHGGGSKRTALRRWWCCRWWWIMGSGLACLVAAILVFIVLYNKNQSSGRPTTTTTTTENPTHGAHDATELTRSFPTISPAPAGGANTPTTTTAAAAVLATSSPTLNLPSWTALPVLPALAFSERFGHQVALSGDGTILAATAPHYGDERGIVRVFHWTGHSWNARTPSSSTTSNTNNVFSDSPELLVGLGEDDHLGSSLALSQTGTILAVGAPHYDDARAASGNTGGNAIHNVGRVHVYAYDPSRATLWQLYGHVMGVGENDEFGAAVALDATGTILAVGAPMDDAFGRDAGSVQVYQFVDADKHPNNNNNQQQQPHWVPLGDLLMGGSWDEGFGSTVALSYDGTILAVGAPWFNGNTGMVRIYQLTEDRTSWSSMSNDLPGRNFGDVWGRALALSGNGRVVAVGAPLFDSNESNVGLVQVFEWSTSHTGGEAWLPRGLELTGSMDGDEWGTDVALDETGDTLAVGAIGHNKTISSSSSLGSSSSSTSSAAAAGGQLHVYQWLAAASSWRHVGAPDAAVVVSNDNTGRDELGIAVALSQDGRVVAKGSHSLVPDDDEADESHRDDDDDDDDDGGHVRVYIRDGDDESY